MSSTFPTTLDSFTDPTATSKLNSPSNSTQHADKNDAIEKIEAKVGVDGSAVTTSHDYKLSGVTGTDKAVSKTGTETLTNKTLTSPSLTSPSLTGNVSGWVAASEAWLYGNANQVVAVGDVTGLYPKGTRIKLTNSTVKYFVVTATVYSTNTTITLNGGSDYSLVDAAVSSVSYSYDVNPQGFPFWFTYTGTINGAGGSIGTYSETNTHCKFAVVGNMCFWRVQKQVTNVGSWSGNVQILAPITPVAADYTNDPNNGTAWTSGSGLTPKALLVLGNVSTTCIFATAIGGSAWQWGGAGGLIVNDIIIIRTYYEF